MNGVQRECEGEKHHAFCPTLFLTASRSLHGHALRSADTRYGLVVTPINYPLTGVNVLLFLSSAWHLGRKIKADFM